MHIYVNASRYYPGNEVGSFEAVNFIEKVRCELMTPQNLCWMGGSCKF